MKAELSERLTSAPVKPKAAAKTTWLDIAIGIYAGGLALGITWLFISLLVIRAGVRLIGR